MSTLSPGLVLSAVFMSVFMFTASTAAAATTYPVYQGCEAPATTYARTLYINPTSGSDTGLGTSAKPYKTLSKVLADKKVLPGDHLILLTGDHGIIDVRTARYVQLAGSKSWIWLDFRPGATVRSMTFWDFSRLLITQADVSSPEVTLLNTVGGSNVIIADSKFSTVSDASRWTAQQWITTAANGISTRNTTCVSVLRNTVTNVRHGIFLTSDAKSFTDSSIKGLAEGNEIRNFSGDGMRPIGSDIAFKNNRIYDQYVGEADGDANHDDGIQLYALNGAAFRNVLIDKNWVQETTNPRRSFNAPLQGISDFSGHVTNLQVTNNVVLVSATHGLTYTGIHDSLIAQNTVANVNGKKTWIYVTDLPSEPTTNVLVKNNVTRYILGVPKGATLENNYIVTDPKSAFVTFDTATPAYDLHAKPGSPIYGKGVGAFPDGTSTPTVTPAPAPGIVPKSLPDSGLTRFTLDSSSIQGTAITDARGTRYASALVNGPTQVAGKQGGALHFDGTQGVRLGTRSLATLGITKNAVTLSAWVNASTLTGGAKVVLAKGLTGSGASQEAFNLIAGAYPSADFSDGTSVVRVQATGSTALVSSGWHLLTATLEGKTATLYVDGRKVAAATNDSFGTLANPAAHDVLSIGYDAAGARNYFTGSLDDVRIYNRALPASEVSTLYAGGAGTLGLETDVVITKKLGVGEAGAEVGALQKILTHLGYYTYPEITAYFGQITKTAVASFQEANALEAVGYVGEKTRALLNLRAGK